MIHLHYGAILRIFKLLSCTFATCARPHVRTSDVSFFEEPCYEGFQQTGTVSTSYGGRGKYHNYRTINLDRAITAVEGRESYRRAAGMYGVSCSTIHDHFTAKYSDMKAGPKPYLTTEDEEELVSFLDVHAHCHTHSTSTLGPLT